MCHPRTEAQGVTPAEAEAPASKAAELMTRYGIDRALLAVQQPDTDQPADRKVNIDHPWARVQTGGPAAQASGARGAWWYGPDRPECRCSREG
jgi:hypothetical protein